MRILMPCAAFPPVVDGGGPISALILAKLLISAGHDVRVVHVGDEDRFEVYDGVPVHRIKPLNLYWNYYTPRPAWQKILWHTLENGNPRAYLAMRKEISDFKPDLMLTDSIENINVASWAAAKSLRLPVAHTVRSAFLLCWKGVMQKGGRSCPRQCRSCRATSVGKRLLSRYVDVVIGESRDILDRHTSEGYFPNAEAHRIPGAVTKIHASGPRSLPTGRPARIGFLGVHTAFKGLDILAAAARNIPADTPMEFYIAGRGDSAFAEEARQSFPAERTKFLGWVEADDFFPQIDALAFPSIGREAFGRVAVEAFSHAVPVIGSDLGGISETIKPSLNGFLVPPKDPSALAEGILKVVSDASDYRILSAGALASASEFNVSRIARTYTEALVSAIRRCDGSALKLNLETGE